MTMTDLDVPVVSRADFLAAFSWRQGEHVSMIGPTGGGKTTLALDLLGHRDHVVALATKPRDATLSKLSRRGFRRVRDWPPPRLARKVLLWPPMREMGDVARQRDVIGRCLADVFTAGGWCVFADELRYVAHTLGLRAELELLWLQGRALGISLVGCTQRPAWVPLEAYSQATHLFFWQDRDESNLRRIAGIGSIDPRMVRDIVTHLRPHHVLYLNTRTGRLAVIARS